MSAKRKDKKGRVLRTGESQRKDLTYQYRYQDITGKRRTVYPPNLHQIYARGAESCANICTEIKIMVHK